MDNHDALLPLAAAAAGDDEAFAVIARRMQPILHHLVRSFSTADVDPDDLEQEAALGLLAAVRAYRPDGGAAFTTFATTCIRNRLISAVRHDRRALTQEPLEDDDASAADIDADPARRMLEREAFTQLQAQLKERLTPLEYRVLLARLSDLSYDDIATRLGISKKAVDNAVQRLRRKMAAEQ